ncbi:MAG: acetyltransferase [Phycisphaeraceae bacterium]
MQHGALLIYGAGGHGLVVAESAEAAGWTIAGFLDDELPLETPIGAWQVIGRGDPPPILPDKHAGQVGGVIVGVGDNAARWHLMNVLRAAGVKLATVIDPTARVSPSAGIEPGVYVGPCAVVNAEAKVGAGTIINSAAVVEHHVKLGFGVHVAPGAVLTGRVVLEDRAMVGANATVLPGRVVGEEAIVGAGAVVTRDVMARTTVIGCPAYVPDDEGEG